MLFLAAWLFSFKSAIFMGIILSYVVMALNLYIA